MSDWGAHTILVSGGFTAFTGPIAARIGLAEVHANQLEIVDGKMTGKLVADIVDASTKRTVLDAATVATGLAMRQALAVGDGANDLPMITAAVEGGGLGVGYHPRPQLATAANFPVRHGDLTALLYAQGVPISAWMRG
jgi:phosphoserine phosphatase